MVKKIYLVTYIYLDGHGNDDEDTWVAHTVQHDKDELRRKVQPPTLNHDVDDSPFVREGVGLHSAGLVPDAADDEARDEDIGAEREDEARETQRDDRRRDLRIGRTRYQMSNRRGDNYVRGGSQSVLVGSVAACHSLSPPADVRKGKMTT